MCLRSQSFETRRSLCYRSTMTECGISLYNRVFCAYEFIHPESRPTKSSSFYIKEEWIATGLNPVYG